MYTAATLYFVDETEIVNLKEEYEDSQICVGIAMIDNYEEIIGRTTGEEQVQLFSQIEKKIYDWASGFKGLVVKSQRDTFVWICEQKHLNELIENKFNRIKTFYKEVMPVKGWNYYDTISVKWRGQVVTTRRDKQKVLVHLTQADSADTEFVPIGLSEGVKATPATTEKNVKSTDNPNAKKESDGGQ